MAHVQEQDWPRVVVYGAGAVGGYFGARLAQAGAPVTLIARPAHVDAIRGEGLLLESAGTRQRVPIAAESDPGAVAGAQVVLLCVKTRDTEAAAATLAPLLAPDALVVSLQNGVDNVPKLRAAGIDALGAVVYVATSMGGPGHVVHAGRGDLIVGEYGADQRTGEDRTDRRSRSDSSTGSPSLAGSGSAKAPSADDSASARTRRIAQWFERAGVPCEAVADVRAPLWHKLIMNCAYNAISAVGDAHYARMLADAETRLMMRRLIDECVMVAQALEVDVAPASEQYDAAIALGEAMGSATSSTAQDLALKRPTEIDSLNGYVAARAAELNVATPLNHALTTLVRLKEQAIRL